MIANAIVGVALICVVLLRTRLGRLLLAKWLLQAGNALGEAGSRALRNVQKEMGR